MTSVTLHLLRHAKVDGHSGDVPLSAAADEAIIRTSALIEAELRSGQDVAFLCTQTVRSRDTAVRIRERLAQSPKRPSLRPVEAEHAIRNPDLFLAGHRVEMVSNGAAMAYQLPDGTMTGEAVDALPFFGDFFAAPDRIAYWVHHDSPPGEDARAVARRIITYCQSLGHTSTDQELTIVAVTHSPVMRAVLVEFMGLSDPGEPDWVEPISVHLTSENQTISFRKTKRSLRH